MASSFKSGHFIVKSPKMSVLNKFQVIFPIIKILHANSHINLAIRLNWTDNDSYFDFIFKDNFELISNPKLNITVPVCVIDSLAKKIRRKCDCNGTRFTSKRRAGILSYRVVESVISKNFRENNFSKRLYQTYNWIIFLYFPISFEPSIRMSLTFRMISHQVKFAPYIPIVINTQGGGFMERNPVVTYLRTKIVISLKFIFTYFIFF